MTYDDFLNFLDKFEEIKSFASKKRYADQYLGKPIGSGTGRIVYDIDGTKVFKIAKNTKGVAQNEAEASAAKYGDYDDILTNVYESPNDDTWLVAEKAKKVNERRIKELTGIPSLSDLNMYLRNFDSQNHGGRKIFGIDDDIEEQLNENEFVQRLINFSSDYSQNVGDWSRPSSYGEVIREGTPSIVLTDYGLSHDVYDTHYNPQRKQKYRMYELFDAGDGNDDILSDIGNTGEIRHGMWGLMPYGVGDGENVVNEDFISFVLDRDKYPTRPLPSAPYLVDAFHECVNNLKETMKNVSDKKRFYDNLLVLQEYLIKQKYYDRDPLEKEEYIINEAEIPAVQAYEAGSCDYGQFLADMLTNKLGMPKAEYVACGSFGHAFRLGDDKILKITTSNSEAESAFKTLKHGPPTYLTEIYQIFKIVDTENNKAFFAIIQEYIPDRPKELFDEYNTQIDTIMPNGLDYYSITKQMRKNFNYNEIIAIANEILTATPEANIPEERRKELQAYIIGLANIQQELINFGIKSDDYTNTANLGYKNGILKYFDVANLKNVPEPEMAEKDIIYLPEDGSSKFSTDDSIGQDDFPTYNQNDTSPVQSNTIPPNIEEDLEYNHVVGDATEDEFMMTEEGKKSYMPNAQAVTVKKKCRLGGQGNTSAACNQGDINNLELKTITEDVDPKNIYNTTTTLRSILKGRRDIAFVELSQNNIKDIKKHGLQVMPIRVAKAAPPTTLMSIIYRDKAKDNAERLRQIAMSHNGYLNDSSPEEAREIGRLLEYSEASIDEYIRRKYGSKIPVLPEPSPDDYDDLAEQENSVDTIVSIDTVANVLNLNLVKHLIENLGFSNEKAHQIADFAEKIFRDKAREGSEQKMADAIFNMFVQKFSKSNINLDEAQKSQQGIYYRSVDEFGGSNVEFEPNGYYEAIDKDGNPIMKYDTHMVSDTGEVAASKTIGGAVMGLYSMYLHHGKNPNTFFIYKITDKPDVDISHWTSGDFEMLQEVRFRKPVKGKYIGKIELTDDIKERLRAYYEVVNLEAYDEPDEKYGDIFQDTDYDELLGGLKSAVHENTSINLPSGDIQGGWGSYKISDNGQVVGEMEIMNRNNGYLALDKIFIYKPFRGKGYANDAMKLLFDYADNQNKIITLTPDNVWGASVPKLKAWYSSLGFVMNKGKNKDFQTMQLMYRLPKGEKVMNEAQFTSINDLPFKQEVEQRGGKIYSVGGAVRDQFLGRESKDLDLLITGIPIEELKDLLSKYGRASIEGQSFSVIIFTPNGSSESIDIAVPRTEKATGGGGYHDFEVTSDHTLPIEQDLLRRDITINAIAKDAEGNIIDPYGGQEDLKNKTIRMTNPDAFHEDPLRMLRAIQFASRFGFKIEPETWKVIVDNVANINKIQPNRFLVEFDKIITKTNIRQAVQLMKDSGMLDTIFGFDIKQSIIDRSPFEDVKTMGEFMFLLTRTLSNPAEFYLTRFKPDTLDAKKSKVKKEIEALEMAYNSAEATNLFEARSIAHNMYIHSPESIKSQILPSVIQHAADELVQGKYPKTVNELAVNGYDLMEIGLKGEEIKKTQKELLKSVYADNVRNDKKELITLATDMDVLNENL